ncbi:MAG TPA: response regulator transcription factor [Kofleriaceae bacterium]|nr:response regulator transcription factor [Kofleriaceae bacterium]
MHSTHPATTRAKIAVVDEHPVFRIGLRTLFDTTSDLELQFEAGSGREALAIAASVAIDVALIDLELPGLSASATASELRRIQPDCKVVGLTVGSNTPRIAEMLRAGASGCALKTQPPDELVVAVHTVLGGERYLPPTIARDQVETLVLDDAAWPLRRLTHRELEVFALIVAGHTNESIAARLFIAKRTVETHRHHIMRKLEARSLVDLVQLAVRHGIART